MELSEKIRETAIANKGSVDLCYLSDLLGVGCGSPPKQRECAKCVFQTAMKIAELLKEREGYALPESALKALTPDFLSGFSIVICSLLNWKRKELTVDNIRTIEGCDTWREAFWTTCYICDEKDLRDYFDYSLSDDNYSDFCAQVDDMVLAYLADCN